MGMLHLSGNIELIRAWLARARAGRAILASTVLAGALTLAGCYGDDGYDLPTRAMKELSPEMLTLLDQKSMPKDSPILVRIFKEESELEVWKQDTTGRFELLKVYPICRWSGDLGPKVKEGDRQAPEGFYTITPGLMNPNSNYYLAINIGFPNAFDRANGRSGAFVMVHGDCSSRGCYAMTDEQIGEIYSLARESFLGGQSSFQIQAYPFRMTPTNLARHRNNPNFAFWKMIKVGNDHFLVSRQEPKVDVCDRHYVFDAEPPANSTQPLVFNPAGHCPAFQVNPQIADAALERQRTDELEIAQLIARDVPVAPPNTGTDGGMNRVFISKLDVTTVSYDNEGHIHVPPQQDGRLPPSISPSSSSESEEAITGAPPKPGFFARLMGAKAAPQPAQVASAEPPPSAPARHSFFGNLFRSKTDDTANAANAEQTATATAPVSKSKPAPHSETAIAAKPKTEPRKTEPREAETPKPDNKPQQEANATQPANIGGLLRGAQPVVPAGTFDNRWGGLQ
jgi:murein L,D-transpeptidase YafK